MKIFISMLVVGFPLFANASNSQEEAYYNARVQAQVDAAEAKQAAKIAAERPRALARSNQTIRNLVAQKTGGATIVSPENFWIADAGTYYVVASNGMGCAIYAGAYFRVDCR